MWGWFRLQEGKAAGTPAFIEYFGNNDGECRFLV